MNTVKKGDKFEDKVFEILSKMLAKGKLGLQPDSSKIFQKKKYYSRDRDSYITTDISIEVTFQGAPQPSMILVVECKDYGSPIPVDDIEEFNSKVIQFTGLNIKAIFVTSNSLQRAALNYAKSRNIAVVRILPSDQVTYYSYWMTPELIKQKSQLHPQQFDNALTQEKYSAEDRDFYSTDGNYIFGNWTTLFNKLLGK